MPARGRPASIQKDLLINCLIKYKDRVLEDNQRIVSKCDAIWITIAKELDNRITPSSLYTFVTCNRYKVREKLTECLPVSPCQSTDIHDGEQDQIRNETNIASTTTDESTFNNESTVLNTIEGVSIFTITLSKTDFTSMIIYKTYRRKDKGRPLSTREYTMLQPGMWQHVLSEKIWECTKLSCGFNFKRHKLSRNGESGYAYGTCKCGSIIKCVIDNTDQLTTKIKCKYIEGEGRCGKRYLRNPVRQTVAEKLQGTSAMKYRIEVAENLMQDNDNVEPPHLFTSNVLRVAKYELMQKGYLHKDPIKALEILKLESLKNIIHNIGLNPFFVHYWSNFQLNVYRTYTLDNTACIYIDATGSIIKKIKRSDKSKTKHIFLYNCVANSEKSGLFPVSQMLSESHNTNAIHYWLMEWIRSGAPRPHEVVCDFSRALLTAAVRSFTGYLTLEEYADACKEDNVPACYIRIDVAHFIKKYANFLKDVRPRIKQFYLSILGQLILCRNIHIAEDIVKGILIIARSETEGDTTDNKKTICEKYKIKLKNLLTTEISSEDIITDDTKNYNDMDDEEENINFSKWSQWAKNIDEDVKILVTDVGDRENAHYMPKFAERLIRDIKLLPLWSCVYRDKFGFGRIPASSASVEGDFNIIKNTMLKTEKTPMRADEFVTKHVNFISGRLKLVHANAETCPLENITEDIQDNENNEIIRQENNINEENCPACKNGHEPTGGHICYICKKYVHALDGCSAPVGEEGYGQQRICVKCQRMNNIEDIIATKEVEDWRGLATVDTQSKGRYLQKDKIQNEFLLEKNICKIPIIKNGSSISLKSVKIEKNQYTCANTCAFDSVLQLFIAAYFDKDSIKNLVCSNRDFKFFELINDVVSYGIKRSSYRLRTMILKDIFTSTILPNNCILINCEVSIAFLCRKLFQRHPSFKEISKCTMGCPERQKALPLVQVKLSLLMEKNFTEIEKDITIQGLRTCCQSNCNGVENTIISDIGQFIMIEIYSNPDDGEEYAVKLEDIPKKIKFSFMKEDYILAGIINFKSPAKQTRQSLDISQDIGHYTAVSYRLNKWIQYDDCKDTETILKNNFIASPHIILYTI